MAHRPLQLLVTALADDDAQNVQLAARYLGASGEPSAVDPLEQVARGDGRGNRSVGPRVEAIEALGRLGASSSLPALQSLTVRRGLLGGRNREVRAAAESAIARIRATGEGPAS